MAETFDTPLAFTWPPPPANPIEFREAVTVQPSPRPTWSPERSQLTSNYLIYWNDHYNAADALLGGVTVQTGIINGIATPYLSRRRPHAHPNQTALKASAVVSAEPWAKPGAPDANRVATYSFARMSVSYETLMWDHLEDSQITNPAWGNLPDESLMQRYIWYSEEDREKSETVRMGAWQWIEAGARFGQPGSIVTGISWPITRMIWKWMRIPYRALPRLAQLASVGCVNDTTFDGCQPGTLLIRAPRYERYKNYKNDEMYVNCSIIADLNPQGWNNYRDPGNFMRLTPLGRVSGGVVVAGAQPYMSVNYRLTQRFGAPVNGIPWSMNSLFRPSLTG